MKKVMLFAALAIAALVSCNKEISVEEVIKPDAVPEGYVPVTLNALYDQDTKASLVDNMVIWDMEEELAVFADGAGDPIKFVVSNSYTLGSSVGVTISGSVPEGTKSFVAVYPWQEGLTCVDGVVSLNIPEEQHIPAECVVDPKSMPSVAYFAGADSYGTFRNVMSLIKFNVGKTEGVEEVRVVFGEGAYSAGAVTAKIDTENDGAPEIGNNCDAYATVTAEGGFLPETDYWISVAPVKATGIMAVARVDNKAYKKVSDKEIVLERNKGVNLGDITLEASNNYVGIKTAEDLAGFLAEADTYPAGWEVEVLNDIDCSGVELVPATSYAGIFDGQGYSIKNWTSNGTPLFVTVTGTLKDFTIDASCKLNLPETLDGPVAFVACNLFGTISGVVNNADISGNVTFAGGRAAAIVAWCDATNLDHGIVVEDCVNNGNITLNTDAHTAATQYVGTIVGSMGQSTENVIRNCTNNGNLTINCSGVNTKNFYIGGIAGGTTNGSNNIGLVNNGDVTLNVGSQNAAVCLAGISSYTTGLLSECVNNGKITFHSDAFLQATFVSGIAGYFASNTMSGCVNYGDVTVVAGAIRGRNGIGDIASKTYNGSNAITAGLTVGGLVSATGRNPIFENSDNHGVVSLTLTDPNMEGVGTHTAARPSVGGLVGDCAGPMTNCNNYADVNVVIGNGTAFTCKNAGYTFYVGGIVGSGYNFSGSTSSGGSDKDKLNKFTLENCNNSGNVYYKSDNQHIATYHAMGGICGWPGTEGASSPYTAKNCHNSGKVTADVGVKIRVGGVHGGAGRMVDCSNTGDVTIINGGTNPSDGTGSIIGGLAGFQSQNFPISNCQASGTVEAKCDIYAMAGLVANIGNVATEAMDGCSANCALIGGPEGNTGLVIGRFNGTSKKIVLGSAEDPIEIAGSIDGTAVSEENVQTYFCGNTGMSLDNHTVYYSLNGKSHRYPACIAEAIYIGNSQSIYNSETWTVNLHQQYVIKLDAEGELVTLVLNKKGKLDEGTNSFEFFPVDKVPAGTFEIDATGVHADNTFSIQSASGEEKYYTGLVKDGRNVPIYDGEIVVKEDNGTYTVNAVLVDEAGKQYEYSYVGALAIAGNDFRAGGAEVNWKNTSSTHFTTKANEWFVSFYMPRKNPADTEPAYASFTFYTAAGEVDLNDVPDGTYTYGVAEADATLKYSNGITKANPGLLSAVSVSLYNAAGGLKYTTVEAESTILTIAKNADGTKNFKYSATVKPYHYDASYNTVYEDPVQVSIDIDVPLGKATDTYNHPYDDKDDVFTELTGPAGTVYVGYWYSKYIGQENDAPKEAIPGTDCNIFAFGSNSNFNNSWSMMISVIAEAGWTFEKNYANRFCNTPVPDGSYTFGTEAKIGALIPLRYSTASRCYVKNTYTGTTYYPVAGTVVLSNGTITVDLTCKATEESLEGRPNSPASVHFTGSTAFTCSYLQDYSALTRVKNLSINSPVPVE